MPRLTDYTGTADLGIGSTSAIPVSTTKDLDAVNQAGRDSMLVNAEQNRLLYQQKVKEHNDLMSAISSGDLVIGEMLDKDRPQVKKYLDSLDNAWLERGKKGFGDIDAAVKYNKALRDAQDAITQAQTRFVVDTKVKQDAASTTLQSERDALLKNHENYLSGFWNDYKPQQKLITLDHPGMTNSILRDALVSSSGISAQQQNVHRYTTKNVGGKITTWDTVTNQPVKGAIPKNVVPGGTGNNLSVFTTIPGKFYDYNKILTNASDDFLHDEQQVQNQKFYMDYVLNQTDPVQLKNIVDQANKKITAYNEQRGFTDVNDPNYVKPLNIIIAPDGSRHTDLSIPEFNAKMALASIGGDYVEKPAQQFNKDIADYLEDVRHHKAQESVDWANWKRLSDQAGVSDRIANSAKIYSESLWHKLATLADNNGNISNDKIMKLTTDELKYLGQSTTEKNQFSIASIKPDAKTSMKINPDGTLTITTFAKDYSGKNPNGKETTTTIDPKGIALNKLGDEVSITTGKEGMAFDKLIPLYSETKSGNQNNSQDYYNNENNLQSQNGDTYTYKDGTVWKVQGSKMVKIK